MYGQTTLYLSGVRWDEEGNLKSGYVVNGCWNFEIKDGEVLAMDERRVVTRWPLPDYEIIEVTEEVRGNYDDVMTWAEQQSKYVEED